MNAGDQRELVRLLELDYEKTTKLIEGVITTGFTIRGWAVALTSALIGFSFQARRWPIAGLAAIITLLFALIDGYHSWLYARELAHAQKIEGVLGLYYARLARGGDDPQAREEFEVALLAHPFGRFTETERFHLTALREARPRLVILILYGTLCACALASAVLVSHMGQREDLGFVFGVPSNLLLTARSLGSPPPATAWLRIPSAECDSRVL